MKTIEKIVKGKYDNPELCEDAIVITDDFAVVIDGATSKSNFVYKGKKDGKIISEILESAFLELDKDASLKETIEFLNLYIQEWYKENDLFDKFREDLLVRPSASVAIYSKYYNEIWQIGDCRALVGDKVIENELQVDKLSSELRVKLLRYLLETKYVTTEELLENDISKEMTKIIRVSQQFIKNKNNGSKFDYTVIDGFDTIYDLVKVTKVPDDIKEIVLCSDGYPKVLKTLEETEAYLKYVLGTDPLLIKIYPFTKGLSKDTISFDDRAYIRFEI